MDEFVTEINRYNLCSWFVLPWIGLNPGAFGDNFLNAYLVRGQCAIAVHVKRLEGCKHLRKQFWYIADLVRGGRKLLLFGIPGDREKDYQTFLSGQYSRLSPGAKHQIRQNSGLLYKQKRPQDETPYSDALLLALERHPSLEAKWREILGDDVDFPDELLSPPGENSFIDL